MLNEEIVEQLSERLVRRIEEANTYTLEQIGKSVKKIGTLTPTKARQLEMILKYGGDYDKIAQKLAEVTKLNIKEIKTIFHEVAKRDYEFKKYLYDYRGKKFIPYKDNIALQDQVNALAETTARQYLNLTNTSMLGFSIKDTNDNIVFKGLRETYIDTIDRAILSISQGKSTFDNEMYRILKELGSSGLKIANYDGRTMRLDSAIRMNFRAGLRDMRYETQKFYGSEFGYNGWEISVHGNPAPDHQYVQGHQFSIEEYEKLQTTGVAKDVNNKEYDMHLELKSGESSLSFRPIREYNCLHYEFPIVIGVSKPDYTEKQLQDIIDRNNKGFEYEGKHYSMYEGEQLMRQIETKIREQKDIQITAKAGGQMDLVGEAQQKITQLTHKYRDVVNASGLGSRLDRARVVGYKRVAIKK